jgi:hypothetical protein
LAISQFCSDPQHLLTRVVVDYVFVTDDIGNKCYFFAPIQPKKNVLFSEQDARHALTGKKVEETNFFLIVDKSDVDDKLMRVTIFGKSIGSNLMYVNYTADNKIICSY